MEWFTDVFWNYVPLYKNLRAVTIILVILELTFCTIALVVIVLYYGDALGGGCFHGLLLLLRRRVLLSFFFCPCSAVGGHVA